MRPEMVSVGQLGDFSGFDEIIDVRSPGEFAEDHIPGSTNCPVLEDRQRAEIVGADRRQRAAVAADRCAHGVADIGIAHAHDSSKKWPLMRDERPRKTAISWSFSFFTSMS